MTLAWYGHLKFNELKWFENTGLISIILISLGMALFEYFFQVPANRIGFQGNGGPFSLLQLKVIQEVITLIIFVLFSLLFFKNESLRWNHLIGMCFLILAVYFIFKK
nr:DMT family protein [Flavobacterium davisii]